MIKFTDWLMRRNKPVQGKPIQGSIKPATPQSKVKDEYDDLEDAWLASGDSAGLSPKRRKELIAQNPKFSDERLKELEDEWRSSQK